MNNKTHPQSKAQLIEIPGMAVIIQTNDGNRVVLTLELAAQLADRMQFIANANISAPSIPARFGMVQ